MGKLNDRNYSSVPQAEMKGENIVVNIDEVFPNPWNYNVQTEIDFSKLTKSIRKHGMVDPPITRSRAGGGYEILGGEHRWQAMRMLGFKQCEIRNLGRVPDVQAKELSILLNEIGGTPDQVRLAQVMRDIAESTPFPEMVEVMPFPERELRMLTEVVDFSFDNLPAGDTRTPEEAAAESDADLELADGPAGAANDDGREEDSVAGKTKMLKFMLAPEIHREMEELLRKAGKDPNATVVRALRYYAKGQAEAKKRRIKGEKKKKKVTGASQPSASPA